MNRATGGRDPLLNVTEARGPAGPGHLSVGLSSDRYNYGMLISNSSPCFFAFYSNIECAICFIDINFSNGNLSQSTQSTINK